MCIKFVRCQCAKSSSSSIKRTAQPQSESESNSYHKAANNPRTMNSDKKVVKFVDNNSAQWDGKVTEVSGETVVRMGRRGADSLERVEVHWPGKGKGKMKVWHAVLVADANDDEQEQLEADLDVPNPKRREIESTSTAPSQAVRAPSTSATPDHIAQRSMYMYIQF